MPFRTMPYRLATAAIDCDHDWAAVYFNPYVLDIIANATERGQSIVIEYRGDPFGVRAYCDARVLSEDNPGCYGADRFASALLHRADYTAAQLATIGGCGESEMRAYLAMQVRAMAASARKCAA